MTEPAPGEAPEEEAAAAATDDEPSEPPFGASFYRHAWIFYLLLALAAVVWLGSIHGRLTLDLFVDPKSWWLDLLLGLGAAAALIAGWWLGRRLVAPMRELEERFATLLAGVPKQDLLPLALLSGFAEEFFFRGAMQTSWGWGWATAIFAALHTGRGRVFRLWTLFALVAGLVFALLTLKRGNLLAAIVAHVAVNAVQLRRLAARREAAPVDA